MSAGVSVVGMACRFPDARTPWELWENVLSSRRAFRRIPPERLNLVDYWSDDRGAVDRTYAQHAAVLADFVFDRSLYRVSAAAYQSADPTHWLALDCAAAALADAGWAEGKGLDKRAVGVIVGNTLTGDYSRAASIRLRWPYVRRVIDATLRDAGMATDARRTLLARTAERYLEALPEIDGETLAGWLSNTIAGRICNHFGFHGGGYAVDGACASSLLALATACNALAAGDLDVVLAGGVDLSLDPFELVGFARAGALATDEMRVYDRRSAGFWPGEGCGFVVLMRESDACDACRRPYAVIRGWGVSSDGPGGLTRPEVYGQSLALQRAYARAGYGIDTVEYFEGHGTGTAVGDSVELTALSDARRKAGAAPPALVGSIKANIGHTKAAAGIAGLIKAAMAVYRQVLPPTVGCVEPHASLIGPDRQLRMLGRAVPWRSKAPLRAGVSAMGFGGINTHVTLEAPLSPRRLPSARERRCIQTAQDAELIVLAADRWTDLRVQIDRWRDRATSMSRAELTDAAVAAQRESNAGRVRLAIVAQDVAGLQDRLATAAAAAATSDSIFDPDHGLFLDQPVEAPRLAFVFPGQGSPTNVHGGGWTTRFARARSLYRDASPLEEGSTHFEQVAIARAAIACLRVLERVGVEAQVGAGHSLGELIAMRWSGAIEDHALLRIVDSRGRAMSECTKAGGMAVLGADAGSVERLLEGSGVVIAAHNAPRQTVVSGSRDALASVVTEAQRRGWMVVPLRVAHAFHSPDMQPAADVLQVALERETLMPVRRRLYSTITGGLLGPDAALATLLMGQLVRPVRFLEVASALVRESDLVIEVGPGSVLTGLMRLCGHRRSVSTDAAGASLAPLLGAIAAAWVLGASVRLDALARGRFSRPFSFDRPTFLSNPCERVADANGDESGTPDEKSSTRRALQQSDERETRAQSPSISLDPMTDALRLVAARADLPIDTIRPEHKLLTDLHFNSFTAAQIVLEIAALRGAHPPATPVEFADASIQEVVEALTTASPSASVSPSRWPGISSWVRAFRVGPGPIAPRRARPAAASGGWHIEAEAGHPLRALLDGEKEAFGGCGTIVCLSSVPSDDEWLRLACIGADAARGQMVGRTLVVVHDAGAGAGFAASLAQEAPNLAVAVVQVSFDAPEASRYVLEEAAHAEGFVHIMFDRLGARRSLQLDIVTPLPVHEALSKDDVLLVSGGGKGIVAECVLELASRTGAALALIGRSDPATDEALQVTFSRLRGFGVRFAYERADVADANGVVSAVAGLVAALGPITGIVHGAGLNKPTLLADATADDFQQALAVKLAGARNLLAAAESQHLRLFVAFGSLIGRAGMRGEAHYALANEALRCFVDHVGAERTGCRCLTIESSVWSGAGMGERLGVIAGLERRGITPLTIDQGVHTFLQLVNGSSLTGSVVVSSRFGEGAGLLLGGPPLPLARFLDKPRVWYPGIELVADAELTSDMDPYLADHVIDGQQVLPGVMGIEAMVQAAAALVGVAPGHAWTLRDVRFDRPILVPAGSRCVIRVVALLKDDGEVEAAVRSDATAFAVDHFSAFCRPDAPGYERTESLLERSDAEDSGPAFKSADSLYDEVFFQRGRFKGVVGYRALRARSCVTDVKPASQVVGFATYLPQSLWLGNPGVRDSVIHSLQACIPLQRLIPTRIERLVVSGDASGPRLVEAVERRQERETYTYDLCVRSASGQVVERFEGLHLREIGALKYRHGLPMQLLDSWLEREWLSAVGRADLQIARLSSHLAGAGLRAVRALCSTAERRADGRPVPTTPGSYAAASHDKGIVFGLLGSVPLGCDLQAISEPSTVSWQELLGADDAFVASHVSSEAGEAFECAATRIWSARESLRKCGAPPDVPLIVSGVTVPAVRFSAGDHVVTTLRVRQDGHESVFALALRAERVAA